MIGEIRSGSIAEAARRNEVSIGSIWHYLDTVTSEEYTIKALEEIRDNAQDIILGVDEHSFSGRKKYVLVITNVTNNTLITILPRADKAVFRTWLQGLPSPIKERIKALSSDMKIAYINAAREVFGDEFPCIVDGFHLVQEANRMVDYVRQCIHWERKLQSKKMRSLKMKLLTGYERLSEEAQDKLLAYLIPYPSLKEAWLKKEVLRSILKDRDREGLELLIQECLASTHPRIITFGKTLKRWESAILNKFTYQTSNAFTEGINNKCKIIKRISYGFKSESNYIKKVLISFN
jgi:transposase